MFMSLEWWFLTNGKSYGCITYYKENIMNTLENSHILLDKNEWKYATGVWPSDLIKVTTIALVKKQEAAKWSYHRTTSLIEWAKIVARILRRRMEKKT